jgi:hypothetical protein
MSELPKPEYLDRYKQLRELDVQRLRGKRVEVEVLPEIELKSKGGLIIQSASNTHKSDLDMNKVTIAVVLAVGNEVEDLGVGQLVELSRMGTRFYSNHMVVPTVTSNKIALIHADEVARVIGSFEDWERARAVFS